MDGLTPLTQFLWHCTPEQHEAWLERSAILEYDGLMERTEADALAASQILEGMRPWGAWIRQHKAGQTSVAPLFYCPQGT
jgi:hypothetical protein